MRRMSLVAPIALVASVALCGCKHSRLEGHWKGSGAEGVAPEAQKTANDFANAMELDFKKDVLVVRTAKDTQTGKFAVVKDEKTSVTIKGDKDDPTEAQTFTIVDDATIKWTVAQGKPAAITFKKQ
jgi:hypothetical protein